MQLHNTVLGLWLLSSLQETYEAKGMNFWENFRRKKEEMRQMFVMRVKEKEAELKGGERGEPSVLHPGRHRGDKRLLRVFYQRSGLPTCCEE